MRRSARTALWVITRMPNMVLLVCRVYPDDIKMNQEKKYAKNVPRVNRVHPMMQQPILVRLVTPAIIKKILAKLLVYHVYPDYIKMN